MDTQYNKYNKKKHFVQSVMFTIFRLFSYSIAVILFCILGFILVKGFHTISWEFITEAPADGMTKGGIWPAIVGTCCLMLGSALEAEDRLEAEVPKRVPVPKIERHCTRHTVR